MKHVLVAMIGIFWATLAPAQSIAQYEKGMTIVHDMPLSPRGFLKDVPLIEPGNVSTYGTFSVTQIYYQPFSYEYIEIVIRDYSINRTYYQEQQKAQFDFNDGKTYAKSFTFNNNPAHIAWRDELGILSVFLGDFVYLEINHQGAEQGLERAMALLQQLDLEKIRLGMRSK